MGFFRKNQKFTQRVLTKKVLRTTGIGNSNEIFTLTTGTPLGPDLNGPVFKESGKYSLIVGVLMYLIANTRPDISYEASQDEGLEFSG